MPADPRRVAGAIAALGPGGVRIAQLLALRRDLFEPAAADALASIRASDASSLAPIETVARELGPARAKLVRTWVAVAEPDPLRWTAQGFADAQEVRIRVALADRVPPPATIAAAIRLATPMLALDDHDAARASLECDLTRWIAADQDCAAQNLRLARWRRRALRRTGTIVARPLAGWSSAHVVGMAALGGLPLPATIALAVDAATLDAHDIEPRAAARRLVEAALEQPLLFGAIPVEPRLDHLSILPGSRVARGDAGAVEPLSTSLQAALRAIARAAGDPALVAARLVALLVPGRDADPAGLADRLGALAQRLAEGDAAPAALLDEALAAVRACRHTVPADLLALARWLAAMAEAALDLDPAVDIGGTARGFLLRRALEEAVALPDGAEAARRTLALLAPLEALPGRLDRLIADAGDPHYRLPVEQHRSPADRAARRAQARLLAVAIGWTGCALLLLVARDIPAGPVRIALTVLLWAAAAAAACVFPFLWRRAA